MLPTLSFICALLSLIISFPPLTTSAAMRISSSRGYKRFFKRSTLETSDYMNDDCLRIHCCVGVVGSRMGGPKTYSIYVPTSDIGQHFGQLPECGKGTDVSFEVKDETFLAHKLVLASRSPVFRAQLFGPMRDEIADVLRLKTSSPLSLRNCFILCTTIVYPTWKS